MIKDLLFSLLFFFGPILLMFLMRYFGLLIRLWILARRIRDQDEPEVIDITPKKPHPPSTAFIVFTLIVSLAIAALVWQRLTVEAEVGKQYVPAHVSDQGKVVPGRYK